MTIKKYINVSEVVELTGHSRNEIINLVKTGVLPAHKARKGHWRLNVPEVEKYFGLEIDKPAKMDAKTAPIIEPKHVEVVTKPATEVKHAKPVVTRLVTNESHYEEVIQRICAAKSSIRLMTANFRRFKLKPTGYQGKDYKDGTPFIKYLMAKAVQGVSVQIVCSRPSPSFTEEWKEYYRQMGEPELFKNKFCYRNHAKVVIVDDSWAYVGSANVTPAGLGQGIFTPGNFEAGIMTDNPAVISQLNTLFSKIMNGEYCNGCHRANQCVGD